jgi:hypothetical protein
MRRTTVAVITAVFIVLFLAALAGSKLRQSATMSSSQVERVAVTKSIAQAPQPALELNVPRDEYAPAATAAPEPNALSAPQIARSGRVSLLVGDVDRTVSMLSRIARQRAGDVFSLQVSNADAATKATAEMQIRVPASRFDETLAAVNQTGKVRERSVSAEDLTGNITDSSARLRNLRRTESDIRSIMDRSGSVAQVLQAENQLSQVREQIETLESDLKSMHARVAYSTIDVSIEAEAANTPVEPGAASQIAAAWQAAVHALAQTTLGFVAVLLWLVVFVPYVILATIVLFVLYAQVRKRLGGATMAP